MADVFQPGELTSSADEGSSATSTGPGQRRVPPSDPWALEVAPWRQSLDRAVVVWLDRVTDFFLTHWALLLSALSGLLVIGAYLSPLLRHLGYGGFGQALFEAYSLICAQTPEHSYYLWGYQAAIDQRLTTLYGTAAVAGFLYARQGSGREALPWRVYLVFVLPIALDGFTQMFGWRQSTWELRTITGALFGGASVFAFYPRLSRVISPPTIKAR